MASSDPHWVELAKRAGIVVGCMGGLIGGAKTVYDWSKEWFAQPSLAFQVCEELRMSWLERSKKLTVNCGIQVQNAGTAVGHFPKPQVSLRYRRRDGSLVNIAFAAPSFATSGYLVGLPLPLAPGTERGIAIIASSLLTDRMLGEVIAAPQKFEYVVSATTPAPLSQSYCFWVEKDLLGDLKIRGELKVSAPIALPSCFADD